VAVSVQLGNNRHGKSKTILFSIHGRALRFNWLFIFTSIAHLLHSGVSVKTVHFDSRIISLK
jgi:hypothetical protein